MSSVRIKITKKPDVTDLAGEKVMIDFDSEKYYMLTGVANEIWDLMEDGITSEDIVAKLICLFEVEEETCRQETLSFLGKLEKMGFISLENV